MSQPSPMPGGDFAMLDHSGMSVNQTSFEGLFPLIFFGFTHCKIVCPENLDRLSDVLELLGDDGSMLRSLYVTVDPERDTPERMRAFLETRYPRFLGLTGTKAQENAIKHAFKVYAEAEMRDAEGDYDVPHSAMTFLMGPDGRYITHFVEGLTASEIAQRIRAALAKAQAA